MPNVLSRTHTHTHTRMMCDSGGTFIFITFIAYIFFSRAQQNNDTRMLSTRGISKLVMSKPNPATLIWRTKENDPTRHTPAHEGLYYLMPDEKRILDMFGHPTPFDPETTRFYKTIGIMPVMIRKPSLSAMDYVQRIKPNMENIRILFYGDKGHGKTHTLAHLIHYLHAQQNYFIIHLREMKKFTRSPWEFNASTSRPGRIDTPLNSALLLQQIKLQNAALFDKHKDDLLCSQDYKWSLREVTKSGEPLTNVIDHGVNRVIHSSDCVAVLFKELMLAADSGKIRLASVLDNVRFLFLREAGVLKHQDHKRVLVDEITVARALKKLIRGTYKNGLVLATCDDKLSPKQNQTPQDAIGQEGWDCFDPFLPIQVPKYSRNEYENCMNFYQDIGWLTRPEAMTREARDEIRFVSGLNPGQVHYLCQAL
jgi:hypothetical protein